MLNQSALVDFHKAHGAIFVEREGWALPLHFGDTRAEYDAVRAHAGFIDFPDRAFLSLTGPDRTSYLQGLISNDVKALRPGQGVYGTFLNQQGKVLGDARVFCLEESFLIDLWHPLKDKILAHLNRYLVADEVEIVDLTEHFGLISIQGPQSEKAAARLVGGSNLPQSSLQHSLASIDGARPRVLRYSHTGLDGFDFIVPNHEILSFAQLVTEAGKYHSATWVGEQALEILRIEAGIPRYGIDFTEDTLLLETGLDHALSVTKGCFLGQEVVERIRSRGHVNKKLAGLLLSGKSEARHGDRVTAGGREIGIVTSSTYSPMLRRPIALAYIHRDYWTPGTGVEVNSIDGAAGATVAALPFVPSATTRVVT